MQAGTGRRGSNTSQSSRYGMDHQAALVTRVHVPEEPSQVGRAGGDVDEEQRKSASREFGPPVPGGRNEGFLAGSVF